ncbi:Sodium-dependent dopamine transporter, partial [Stegodyphus mimosarum]
MELVLGQYHRQGPISVWKFCPLFKGVGYCCVLVSWYVSFYYNVIIAWTLYYMFISFSAELPWIRCNNPWNTERCWESRNGSGYIIDAASALNTSAFRANRTSPALEFFDRAVLEIH